MTKCYVLDTNVLIHDPEALLSFEDNDVLIPLTVLEELDKLKSSRRGVSGEAREAIRELDRIIGHDKDDDVSDIPITRADGSLVGGRLSFLNSGNRFVRDGGLALDKMLDPALNDNLIINALLRLQAREGEKPVILVTKDINMRIKAKAVGLNAEDYRNDKLVSDVRQMGRGYSKYSGDVWGENGKPEYSGRVIRGENGKGHGVAGDVTVLLPDTAFESPLFMNEYVVDNGDFIGRVVGIDEGSGDYRILVLNREDVMNRKAWGLKPKSIEQGMALDALLDPDIHLVTLSGQAGSGKTILALAAGIAQVLEKKRYSKIIVTRSTPSIAEEQGFLPGSEQEKMNPWLGAINDNLEALHRDDHSSSGSIEYVMEKARIEFKALNYIRGRSFQDSFILIDECQNLTAHQMKTIITRAGEGSKVICLGNLSQIDTPYLSSTSSGLTYLVEKFRGFNHGVHIHLNGTPRSLLSAYAEEHL